MLIPDMDFFYRYIFEHKIPANSRVLVSDKTWGACTSLDTIIDVLRNRYIFVHKLGKRKLDDYIPNEMHPITPYILYLKNELEDEHLLDFYDIILVIGESRTNCWVNKSKELLNDDGKLIIFESILTSYYQYMYHPISFISKFFNNDIYYMEDFQDMIRHADFKVIDVCRIETINIPTYPLCYYALVCKVSK